MSLLLRTTQKEHISNGQIYNSVNDVRPEISEVNDMQYRTDGNSVDVETEMAQLAKNTQRYIALSNLEGRVLKSMRSVITGGGS
jgi:flagellar basal-body rod protein FlgB